MPKPNILFLMTDQMQAAVLDPSHPCKTPNIDRLASKGVRFTRAYTPNAVCSPARASLMTGLLPHNHGVLAVTHTVDKDQARLRNDKPHWSQELDRAGYLTGYFGKWHIDEHQPLQYFGWQINGEVGHGDIRSELFFRKKEEIQRAFPSTPSYSVKHYYDSSTGYKPTLFYGATNVPMEARSMGIITSLGLDFLDKALADDRPWCCFVSVPEPHDPFIAGNQALEQYDIDKLPLSPSAHDELAGRPNIYRRAARIWKDLTDRQRREAAACYYASITETDQQFGKLIDRVDKAGKLDNTIVILTTDHGELLGAHGLYCKNFSASEEIYNIPLVIAGPGTARNTTTCARVGLHDLCQTILELTGSKPFLVPDSRSFLPVLQNPKRHEKDFLRGFAEYFGGRMILTQRVVWDDNWKFVFNGFDFDELYNLDQDPHETNNMAESPDCQEKLKQMTLQMWQHVKETGDHTLLNCHYPTLRIAPYGPGLLENT